MGATSKKQPLYGQLVDSLREKIETEYEPGDLLPSERELSEDYCISRTTVRLALKELETLGFIKRRQAWKEPGQPVCFGQGHAPKGRHGAPCRRSWGHAPVAYGRRGRHA